MRMCPPEDAAKQALCTRFDRHLIGNDYYQYNGSFNTQVRVWQRPQNEADLRKEFFTKIGLPFGKAAIEGEYRASRLVQGQLDQPTDMDLLNWYIRKNGNEELLSCKRVVVDYTVASQDLPANAMLDAWVNLQSDAQLFSDKPCDDWLQQQNKEFAHYREQNQAQTGSGDNLISSGLSRLSSFLGGRRSS
jgi:hypothetical protein